MPIPLVWFTMPILIPSYFLWLGLGWLIYGTTGAVRCGNEKHEPLL